MKIKALSRPAASGQAPGSNTPRLSRNLNPELHPFERAREYTRALNATKLERMFAQPFLASLEPGHVDGVYSFAKDPESYALPRHAPPELTRAQPPALCLGQRRRRRQGLGSRPPLRDMASPGP